MCYCTKSLFNSKLKEKQTLQFDKLIKVREFKVVVRERLEQFID